jgi:hypothetical protein
MKKILSVILTLLVGSTAVFAIENSLDVNFAAPIIISTNRSETVIGNQSSVTDTTNVLNGFGVNINDTVMLTRNLGARVGAGFLWPSQANWSSKNTTTILGTTTTSSSSGSDSYSDYYDSCFNFNLFAGVAIRPLMKKNYQLLITPGADFSWVNAKAKSADSSSTDFKFGLGVDFTFEFNVYKKFYANVSLPCVYQFVQSTDGKSNDDFKGCFRMMPQIGVGYRF